MADKLRLVMVGCGGMSGAWLKVASQMEDVAIIGLVDIRRDMALQRREEYHLQQALVDTDLTAMLNTTHPDIVFDCTVPEAHVTVTLEALKHGCHVLGEKPMADSMENAHRMVDAARQANRLYAVIQNRRYMPQARRVRHFLQSNTIGSLTIANCDFYIGAHFGGFRDHMQHVLLVDMAIHTFDAARFLTNTDPVAVYCQEWNPDGSWYDHDAAAVAIFELSHGLIYTYRGCWCAEGLSTSWECDWRFVGKTGSVKWDGGDNFRAEVVTGTGGFTSNHTEVNLPGIDTTGKVDGHSGLIHEFVHCVHAGTVPETICTDNIKSLSMVFGAIESATTGKRVEIA